jgi:hypothetical protein
MNATPLDLDPATITATRERVRAGVTRWTDRIVAGAYCPTQDELDAVVALCTEYFLPIERARVRRWMAP